jgi:multiple sugar transport system permease protein
MWGPIIANIWFGIPFFAITLLAALKSIPPDLYEAAALDGATAWQRFTRLTMPFLAPTIAITVMLRTIWIATFADLIFVMTGGGPAGSTNTVATYIYVSAFRAMDKGYAAAVAVLLLLLLTAYALILIAMRRRLLPQ